MQENELLPKEKVSITSLGQELMIAKGAILCDTEEKLWNFFLLSPLETTTGKC